MKPKYLAVATITAGLLLSACGGASRTISEQTTVFPTCDVAQDSISVERIICKDGPCQDSGWRKGLAFLQQHNADFAVNGPSRAAGVEGNTATGLIDANVKMTRMLVNALKETGCFAKVEPKGGESGTWRVIGTIDTIKASISGSHNEPLNQITQTNRNTQKANVKMTVELRKGEDRASAGKKQFKISAERVGERKSNYARLAEMDWTRKHDEDGFGDTAMQDVANEIVLEAATFITEKTAGSRIARRVAPPLRQPESEAATKPDVGKTEAPVEAAKNMTE